MTHSSQPPIYSVVGPTAVGKTAYALELAQRVLLDSTVTRVDLISADSKQVYSDLQVISGADIPAGFQKNNNGSFSKGSLTLHGVSMLDVAQEWSVAHFVTFARNILIEAQAESRAVIVVGGTGLYQQKLFESSETLSIPPNAALRSDLEKLSIAELQVKASQENPEKFYKLNNSDLHNKRRLVRLIEVAQYNNNHEVQKQQYSSPLFESTVLGLAADLPTLEKRIQERVVQRFDAGAIDEVERLMTHKPPAAATALSCLGVADIASYLRGEISKDECLHLWALHEFQYAKRQLTWWKKIPTVEWMVY